MNPDINLTILKVINDRKTVHIKELERIYTDNRVKEKEPKIAALFARIDECDTFLDLLTKKFDETAESRLREMFRDIKSENGGCIGGIPCTRDEPTHETPLVETQEGPEDSEPQNTLADQLR